MWTSAPDAPDVVGIDAAAPAVDYALDVGLLDTGAARGLDPAGKESEGAYHVAVYLSRPAADAAQQPIDAVLSSLA